MTDGPRSTPRQVAGKPGGDVWSSNARTARALGLTLPQALLFRADRVIE